MKNMPTIKRYKYLILGAGPSGLTFANKLLQSGEKSFLVLEKENEAGGLCRSKIIANAPIDIGGGHFLDVKRKDVLDFIFKFMPAKEWNEHNRISTIKLDNFEIDYPFESNIWQFPIEKQLEYLLSISKTGSSIGLKMPKKFIDWISWKLGDKIAEDYMIPYNEKIWSIDLNKLGTYWLHKLPDVSLEDTFFSCLQKSPAGKMPAHEKFLYPKKHGYGEVWKRMAANLGDKIIYNTPVHKIDAKKKIVNDKFQASKIITTIPWKEIKSFKGISDSIKKEINSLEYSSVRVTYHNKNKKTKAHWTYIPEQAIPHHRELYRHNFCTNARGYWTEMNEKRSKMQGEKGKWRYLNKHAYPLNTINKPQSIQKILAYFSQKEIYGLGRWGKWEHMNSDIAVENGMLFAKEILKKSKNKMK